EAWVLGARHIGPDEPAEIDGSAGKRVVHRHDGGTVARDSAAIAERAVERLAERDRRVFRRVMIPGLPVAAPVHEQVQPAVECELLEQMVVEAGARSNAN